MRIEPPYWAVLFTSVRTDNDDGYAATAERMVELARKQNGFLGVDSVHNGVHGITLSYWTTREAIAEWKTNAEHLVAQARGTAEWYRSYDVRIARIEEHRHFER